jgi:hypothetical protein
LVDSASRSSAVSCSCVACRRVVWICSRCCSSCVSLACITPAAMAFKLGGPYALRTVAGTDAVAGRQSSFSRGARSGSSRHKCSCAKPFVKRLQQYSTARVPRQQDSLHFHHQTHKQLSQLSAGRTPKAPKPAPAFQHIHTLACLAKACVSQRISRLTLEHQAAAPPAHEQATAWV